MGQMNVNDEAEVLATMARYGVPEHLQHGLMLYVMHHVRPGSGLTAILTGDLFEAFARADEMTVAGLPAVIKFLVNQVPGNVYGTKERVREHLAGIKIESDMGT